MTADKLAEAIRPYQRRELVVSYSLTEADELTDAVLLLMDAYGTNRIGEVVLRALKAQAALSVALAGFTKATA